MPCTDGGVPYEPSYTHSAQVATLQARNNKLAAENDLLRETLINIVKAEPGTPVEIDAKVMKMIQQEQVAHRKVDLDRLAETITKLISTARRKGESFDHSLFEKLGRVMLADPKQPLRPQLGFDPDEY